MEITCACHHDMIYLKVFLNSGRGDASNASWCALNSPSRLAFGAFTQHNITTFITIIHIHNLTSLLLS